jgi:hypothetical protein
VATAKKPGAPSKFSTRLATEICTLIAGGQSLRAVCKLPDMPHRVTVLRWLAVNEAFAKEYATAHMAQADAIEEDMVEIESKLMKGRMDPQRAKVALSSMQWRAERKAPKKYGTKIQQEITGRDGGPVVIAGAPSDADL